MPGPEPKRAAMPAGQLDRSQVYRWMPREQQLLQACAAGRVEREELTALVRISQRRLRHDDVLRYSLRLLRMGALGAIDRALVVHSASSLLRRTWVRKTNFRTSLRLAFFYDQPYFRRVSQSVVSSASRHRTIESASLEELIDFRPDVVLSPQAHPADIVSLRSCLPTTVFVYLRHGLASKANALVTAGYYDTVCVSSPFMRDYFLRCGAFAARSLWVTGYPQMDAIAAALPCPSLTAPTILYAPTHNPNLTSVDWLLPPHLIEVLDKLPDVRLAVKLHPHLRYHPSSIWRFWREAAEGHDRIEFADDPMDDLSTYLRRASVLVSDFSSAPFLFLPFDRPIVWLNSPGLRAAANFDPEGIEWICRDVGDQVDSLEDLHGALSRAILNPKDRQGQRRKYARLLFGDTLDGKCGARVIAQVEALFGFGPL